MEAAHNPARDASPHSRLSRRLVLVLAIGAATAIANLYWGQPLLAGIARTLHLSVRQASIMPTMAELGYALGLALFVPLGDIVERRRLITILLGACALFLAGIAIAPSAPMLYASSLLLGISASVVQVVVPLSAALAAPEERGEVVGIVNCVMFLGILAARILSGFIGGAWGWRAMYWLAALLNAAIALALTRLLPLSPPAQRLRYSQLMGSLKGVLAELPDLRESALLGALGFAGLQCLWGIIAFFVSHPPYHYGPRAAGLLALGGIPGALLVPVVGRIADRRSPILTTGVALMIGLSAYLFLALFGHHLLGLIVGVIILDIGVHSNHVSNQTRVYALKPEARNRIATIYMVSYFFGGSLGTMAGANAWSLVGWTGVCGTGVMLFSLALLIFARGRLNHRLSPISSAAPVLRQLP
ncbi:MAG TPA: MFS transporter [Candidatus Binataceae bacterium]|nr:MFS transporter [Candidatus Binataceae bacterium]